MLSVNLLAKLGKDRKFIWERTYLMESVTESQFLPRRWDCLVFAPYKDVPSLSNEDGPFTALLYLYEMDERTYTDLTLTCNKSIFISDTDFQ
jgi:hypothetical protein